MAKRHDLKAKLKAADKRRRNRAVTSRPNPPVPRQTPQRIDVTGLFVDAILKASAGNHAIRDVDVTAALRNIVHLSDPKTAESQAVYRELTAVAVRNEAVTDRAIREAALELLEISKMQTDEKLPDSFLKYLAVLVG
ncbi:hypothetical protein [Stieleria varia]|uniref:Uncharacterized protein n=1 Tax=Stieleria varia TaxID=2528005 RepID=A0A5C6B9A3_9BACT|nr:hypothetical protein [Stieleria varia]TWU07846.1 hypothetical protein Pla52n_04220 [Stieleria varia]